VVELFRPKMSHAQGNDHLSYQWCSHEFHTYLNFILLGEWKIWAPSNFNSKSANSVCQYLALDAKELRAHFLGGVVLELNNAVLYRNEHLLCTFSLKVISPAWQCLGVGEVMPSKILLWHLSWIGSELLEAFSSHMYIWWPLHLSDLATQNTFLKLGLFIWW
jgi:hypothetical protein